MITGTETLGAASALMASLVWAVAVGRYSLLSMKYAGYAVSLTRAGSALIAFFLASSIFGFWNGEWPFVMIELRSVGWLGLSVLASYALADVLFLSATRLIGVSTALVIASTYPLWSALAGWTLRGESFTLAQGAGVLLVVTGTAIVIISAGQSGKTPKPPIRQIVFGVGLAGATSLLWALNAFSSTLGSEGLSVFMVGTVRMTLAVGMCLLMGWIFDRRFPRPLPWSEVRTAWWAFLPEGFCGPFFYLASMKYAPLAISAALTAIAPVFAVLIGWILRTESPRLNRTIGVVVTVGGIILLVSSRL